MQRTVITIVFCFAFFIVIGGAAQEAKQDLENRNELMQELAEIVRETVTDAEAIGTNGFRMQSWQARELDATLKPSGEKYQNLSVTADGVFKVRIEKGRPVSTGGGLGIYHRESGAPMLIAGDENGDGRLDIIVHSVLDENGQTLVEVIDYEADGQADVRMNLEKSHVDIWHMDRWYRTERREGRRGIVVNGDFKEVRNVDNRLTVQ